MCANVRQNFKKEKRRYWFSAVCPQFAVMSFCKSKYNTVMACGCSVLLSLVRQSKKAERWGYIYILCVEKGFLLQKRHQNWIKKASWKWFSEATCEIAFSLLSHGCVAITVKFNPLGSCLLAAVHINNRVLWVSNENALCLGKAVSMCYRKRLSSLRSLLGLMYTGVIHGM